MKLMDIYNQSILTERYVNLFGPELKQYIDVIWDMLQKAYAGLDGGFATARTKEELIKKTWLTKCVRRNGKIVACKLYADKLGRKSIAGATDGSAEGKAGFYKMIEEDFRLKRAWGEVSGKMEHITAKQGAIPVPNIYAEKLTGKPILDLNPDGIHYTREIGGEPHEKVIMAWDGFIKDTLGENKFGKLEKLL